MEQKKEEEERQESDASGVPQWHELVDDLWTSESNLEHLREDASSVSYVNVFDPSTELYGFQTKSDIPEPESLPPERPESPEPAPPSPKPDPEPPKPKPGLKINIKYCNIQFLMHCAYVRDY